MTHEASRQALDFGTAAARDGESMYSAWLKTEANFAYAFGILDSISRTAANVAALAGLSDIQDNEPILLKAYRTEDDGGGNLLRYDSGSTATCDGVFVFDGIGGDNSQADTNETWVGSGTGRFIAIDQSRITVRQAGCYADGTNASVTQKRFSSAIDACRYVLVTPGDYRLTTNVSTSIDNTTVEGFGESCKLTQTTADRDTIKILNSNCVIRGLHIIGSGSGTFRDSAILIDGSSGTRLSNTVIEGCYIENCRYPGVLADYTDGTVIRNNHFFDSAGVGSAVSGDVSMANNNSNFVVEGNKFWSDVEQNLRIRCSTGEVNGVVRNNVFNNASAAGVEDGSPVYKDRAIRVLYDSTADQRIEIANNLFKHTRAEGVLIEGAADSTYRQVIIRDNRFISNGSAATTNYGAVFVDTVAGTFYVEGNTIDNFQPSNSQGAIYVDAEPTSRVFVRGNNVDGSACDGVSINGDASQVVVEGNYIECDKRGININMATASPITVAGNKIEQNADVHGIFVDNVDTTQVVTVRDNDLVNAGVGTDYSTQAGIHIVEQKFSVRDNLVRGYAAGFRCPTAFSARIVGTGGEVDTEIRDNHFDDCDIIYVIEGSAASGMCPVYGTTVHGTLTTRFSSGASSFSAGVEIGRTITVEAFGYSTSVSAGDGAAYVRIPAEFSVLSTVGAQVGSAQSSGNAVNIMVSRLRAATAGGARTAVDMLSTSLTIDASEWDSKDAATAAVINTSNDDVQEGDLLRIDVDDAGTGTTGLFVTLGFL